MLKKRIGVIGYGNMGSAILRGAIGTDAFSKEDFAVYDILSGPMKRAEDLGISTADSNARLCDECDIILLAVKPQNAAEALESCKGHLKGKVLVSIVAGLWAERIAAMIDENVRILRVMPNTPALVSEGMFVLCSDNTLNEEEITLMSQLFSSIGIIEWLPEKLIDVACGLSGGGPAYTAMFIEALADGAVKQGLPRDTAYKLAAQTCLGTSKMILDTKIHPGALKDMVSSPGGTTIEGVEALEKGGFRYSVMNCIKAATEKSKEL
ncbi:pyrroline-5-carboxylate reductase [Muricomes intestini]|jgi:pyrroline-5-carboxylate reductase|uniref:Pyrroline-5-carboxylate reductase n=1 Tax=Muricomes intestini TaxID=1796634 RepID=A0A4R3K772_9FIRM|nr:pyrroline-5-carboxylate reductase [Muricomes intestini]TCS78796.1 pyrroline-5-carboxylate reductase [Muricomes intestini]HAX50750.1 pyrroline-5-carboxylate reductase [Lachnospiraceae bacterium]